MLLKILVYLKKTYVDRTIIAIGYIKKSIYASLYLEACKSFPDNQLSDNANLAIAALEELLGFSNTGPLVDKVKLLVLKEKYALKECANIDIANYHRVTAYCYARIDSQKYAEEINSLITKAGEYTAGAQLPTRVEFQKIKKEAKRKNRQLKKEVRLNNEKKVEQEKLRAINPITITATHFSIVLTLISTLFFISGFLYTKLFFYWFGVNVGDFYTVQDYVSSSIDIISTTAISALIGLVALAYGVNHGWSNVLWDEQFEISENKKRDHTWFIIVFVSLLMAASFLYRTGTFPSAFLVPSLLTIINLIFNKAPIWKYIENKIPVMAVCIVVVFFLLHLGLKIRDNLEEIKGNDFVPPYTLTFKEGYKKYERMRFVTSNSSYVFLLNEKSKTVEIVPKSSVISFEVNREL
ncbi:hypothetical protein [Vibrio alginolyticus]|uniref:hypothetical protein n=1 Tax=Vibrio alginolyticus TaxID=663 RepID=UPI00155859FB|nr:hypothetical protein [Vibrio alginolyticus]